MAGVPGSLSSPLLGGIRGLLTCDGGEVVSGIAGFVVSQHRGLDLLSRATARPDRTAPAVALSLLNGFRCFIGVYAAGAGGTVVVARRPNERRAVDHLKGLISDRSWTELVLGWRIVPMAAATAALSRTLVRDCRRVARLTRRLARRHGVFRALRAIELAAYYSRYSQLLASRPFRLAIISSHSNPHGIALHLAARRAGVPVVLITHGMPVRPLARLHYDLAILECEAARRIYQQAGCRMDRVVIKSHQRNAAPMRMPPRPGALTIGVFLSKDPREARVLACVQALLGDSRVEQILVRPHPVNLWPGLHRSLSSLGDSRVTVRAATGSPVDDLRRCDLAIAGNSTVLLDGLIGGCPSCYVRGLDHGPYDVQGFVRDGLVYELTQAAPVDLEAVARFYARDGWPHILRHYADVDRDQSDVDSQVRAAFSSLGSPCRPGAHQTRAVESEVA